jgi:hypothetical protein
MYFLYKIGFVYSSIEVQIDFLAAQLVQKCSFYNFEREREREIRRYFRKYEVVTNHARSHQLQA